jgi:thymidylate synthase
LTHLIASVTGLKAAGLVIQIGDAHIYKNHIRNITNQIKRSIMTPPRLILNKKESIFDYKPEDIKLESYDAHPKVFYKLNV